MSAAGIPDRTPTLPSVKPPPRPETIVAVLAIAYGLVALAAINQITRNGDRK